MRIPRSPIHAMSASYRHTDTVAAEPTQITLHPDEDVKQCTRKSRANICRRRTKQCNTREAQATKSLTQRTASLLGLWHAGDLLVSGDVGVPVSACSLSVAPVSTHVCMHAAFLNDFAYFLPRSPTSFLCFSSAPLPAHPSAACVRVYHSTCVNSCTRDSHLCRPLFCYVQRGRTSSLIAPHHPFILHSVRPSSLYVAAL